MCVTTSTYSTVISVSRDIWSSRLIVTSWLIGKKCSLKIFMQWENYLCKSSYPMEMDLLTKLHLESMMQMLTKTEGWWLRFSRPVKNDCLQLQRKYCKLSEWSEISSFSLSLFKLGFASERSIKINPPFWTF